MKQPNWKVPFVLSFSLLALGSFAYWLQYSHKPKKDRADTASKKPISLPSEQTQIASFRIKSASTVIEGKCDSLAEKTCTPGTVGKWTLTYPQTLKADAEAVKDALNNLNTMVATDTIDLSDETPEKRASLLNEYGLSPDKRTKIGTEFFEVTLQDGKKLAAWFGEPYPVGDKTFVGSTENGNMNEKTIFVVSNFYKGVFSKDLTNFRDKMIFDFNRADITDISATTFPDKTTEKFTAHVDNGTWVINGKRADHDRMETLLTSILQAKAIAFPGNDVLKGAHSVCKYELKSKTDTYTFELFEKASKPIHLPGKPEIPGESHFYLTASTLKEPVEVAATLQGQINKKISELRYALLLNDSEKATTTTVSFEGKGFSTPAQFKFDGKNWSETDSGPKMDPLHVPALLESMATTRAKEIIEKAPKPAADGVTATLGDSKNGTKFKYQVYAVKDTFYAKDLNSTAGDTFVITPAEKNAFPFNRDSWKLK